MDGLASGHSLSLDFIEKSLDDILSFNLVKFTLSVLVNKFSHVHITTSNSNKWLIAMLYLYVHSLLSELVDSFAFSQEHYFHLVFFWELV